MHLSIGPRMLRGLSATTQLALAAPLLRDRTTHDRHLAHGRRAPSRVAGDGGSSPDRGYIQMSAPETRRGDAAPHALSLSAVTVAHCARGWPRAGTRPVGDLAGSNRWILVDRGGLAGWVLAKNQLGQEADETRELQDALVHPKDYE
jgi:hypothetical protein